MTGLPLLGSVEPTDTRGHVAMADLPERAVQFGTGALLRGLVDAIIDDANRAGVFNGRIVAIGSTSSGRDRNINRQRGMFTLLVQGIDKGAPVRERRVVRSLSRALSASQEWDAVLECARNPLLDVIFSNTTEVGIALDAADAEAPADVRAHADGASKRASSTVPSSFPAKLTRFLLERARAFAFAPERGVVIVPCELIERNGDTLRDLVLELARRWKLEPAFERWLESVSFHNTLVDRIVPGSPSEIEDAHLSRELGYRDALLTVCEPYRLLAIQGNATLAQRLRFARPELGVEVVSDLSPYRERKVRLLNGGHTIAVSLALMAGCQTVREALDHDHVGRFLRRALLNELVPTVSAPGSAAFAREVLQRFANPYVEHRLHDITLHGGAKMRVRVVPAILAHGDRTGRAPESLALGFAAYLLYASGVTSHGRGPDGSAAPDDIGLQVRAAWEALVMRSPSEDALVRFSHGVCGNADLWGVSLNGVADFAERVARHLVRLTRHGAIGAIESHLASATPTSPLPVVLT